MDAGGVQKEFFMLLLKDILDPSFGMFQEDEESKLIWFCSEVSDYNMCNRLTECCELSIQCIVVAPSAGCVLCACKSLAAHSGNTCAHTSYVK